MRMFADFAPGGASTEVEDLQNQLNMLGFGIPVSRVWDAATSDAVLELRGGAGLSNEALVDAAFMDVLFAELERRDPTHGGGKPQLQKPIFITGKISTTNWLLIGGGVLLAAALVFGSSRGSK